MDSSNSGRALPVRAGSLSEIPMDEFSLEPGAASHEGAQSPQIEVDYSQKKPSQRVALLQKYDSWGALDEATRSVAHSPQSPRGAVRRAPTAEELPPRPVPAASPRTSTVQIDRRPHPPPATDGEYRTET